MRRPCAFTGVLEREKIVISMDGRGRVFDNIFVERLWRNVKYEDVYLNGYATMGDLMVGLSKYFSFYNSERPHQSLGNETPDVVYRTAIGGGALIVEKFLRAAAAPAVPPPQMPNQRQQQHPKQNQQRGSAVQLQMRSGAQLKFREDLS